MNLLKKILLSTICFIFMADCFAQKMFQQSDLVGKKWIFEGTKDNYFDSFYEYTDTGKESK